MKITPPQAFKDAVRYILNPVDDKLTNQMYEPYADIPYTAIEDPMEDNLRNRLMMFIGKFSDKCQENMKKGKPTPPKEQLSDGSLIKWENKNNPRILRMARELIWVAYNAEKYPELGFETHHKNFSEAFDAITAAEEKLYAVVDRHLKTDEVEKLEHELQAAIENFQSQMPSVFDPFAGGGAIPLEAARLGCRSFGNDINPVAHIIEKGSAEFPQKYGKPILYSECEFIKIYGERGLKLLSEQNISKGHDGMYMIPNRLAFDIEYYAHLLFASIKDFENDLYPTISGCKPMVYYWGKVATCTNPSCEAKIPLLRQFYLSKRRGAPKNNWVYLNPIVNGKEISFEVKKGECKEEGWIGRANLKCPCCGNMTEAKVLKKEFVSHKDSRKLLAIIYENNGLREYKVPSSDYLSLIQTNYETQKPIEPMPVEYTQALPSCTWGISKWGDLFSDRQAYFINLLKKQINQLKSTIDVSNEYNKTIIVYLTFLLDRVIARYTEFGVWHVLQETVEHPFGRQAIPMKFDYPEMNPYSNLSGAYFGQLNSIIDYIKEENSFASTFINSASGDTHQFESKSLTCVVTDPPYYDAIAYADLSDFFYVWQKQILGDLFDINYATMLTPKVDECTALKHRHKGNELEANNHFENKLLQIFDSIEKQTSDIVSIMFAHQSTEAWTTLCNSILDARMSITGSWPLDTEVSIALKADKAFLESSVTVACRPSERKGYGDYKSVKKDIEKKVTEEVESLYELGFRGADLLTACFGQAVSEFGKYKSVEKSDGSEVKVAELLEMARNAAFDALLKGVQGDDFTKFYIGWLQLNGVGETDFDDATKFTRVGVNVNIKDIQQEGLLILEGKKMHIAMAKEHIGGSSVEGTRPEDSPIAQAHRFILLNKEEDRGEILKFVREICPEASSPLWRLLATLKELLPANDDQKQVVSILQNAEDFRQHCHEEYIPKEGNLFGNMEI